MPPAKGGGMEINMNILYTCNDNYIWLMGISMTSLFENNKHIRDLDVYLLGENIPDSSKKILEKIAQEYNRKVDIIDVPALDIPERLLSGRWPMSAYTRLYSAQMLPKELERILYLDCDTIVTGDLSALETIDISDNIFYGVKDCVSGKYKQNISLKPDSNYINAGVIMINLSKLREMDISKVLSVYMESHSKLINYADQDVLNGVFCNDIGILNPEYNIMTIDVVHSYKEICVLRKPTSFYSEKELEDAIAEPVVIHYTTNMRVIRPWYRNTNHPLAYEFHKYMKISPWAERPLDDFEFSTLEARVIKVVMLFPKSIAYRILGWIHSYLKPIMIRCRAIKSFRGNAVRKN